MCDDFLYHHNVLTHHFLFYHYPDLSHHPLFIIMSGYAYPDRVDLLYTVTIITTQVVTYNIT
ncbi:MAG: hypothetical protein ACTFAK_13875 [Candidatus Electronema sp. VV]